MHSPNEHSDLTDNVQIGFLMSYVIRELLSF